MATHVFDVGSAVSLTADWKPAQKAGRYIVEAQMPPLGTLPQYRIKSEAEGFRRVVVEHQLSSFDATPVEAVETEIAPVTAPAPRLLPGEED